MNRVSRARTDLRRALSTVAAGLARASTGTVGLVHAETWPKPGRPPTFTKGACSWCGAESPFFFALAAGSSDEGDPLTPKPLKAILFSRS